MNNFKIEIYNHEDKAWEDYTNRAVFPLSASSLLDERLDEGEMELKRVKKPYFAPNTIVRITRTNHPSAKFTQIESNEIEARANNKKAVMTYMSDGTIRQVQEQFFLVASDNSIEKPIGSGLYEHKIYIIEPTKIMEGFLGDSITFTNPLGNNYIGD